MSSPTCSVSAFVQNERDSRSLQAFGTCLVLCLQISFSRCHLLGHHSLSSAQREFSGPPYGQCPRFPSTTVPLGGFTFLHHSDDHLTQHTLNTLARTSPNRSPQLEGEPDSPLSLLPRTRTCPALCCTAKQSNAGPERTWTPRPGQAKGTELHAPPRGRVELASSPTHHPKTRRQTGRPFVDNGTSQERRLGCLSADVRGAAA